MAAREWFRGFFDDAYLAILQSQRSAKTTRLEVDFLVETMGLSRGARILDVPCGYGRHSAELARRGMDVVGIDLSPAMIREARRRWPARTGLRFERGDMRRLDRRNSFDGVACLFTSFGYFNERENLAVLRRMAAALRPGGTLVIDHRNPAFYSKLPSRSWSQPDTGSFILEERTFDRRSGVIETTWILLRRGERPRRRAFRVQFWTLPQWRRALERVGLRFVRACGSFDGSQFRRTSYQLIVVAERA